MADRNQREFRRILIIKPSSFGDVIHALPVLAGLRRRYPRAKISWLVANSCAGLLEGHPALDEVIPFDRHRYGRIGRDWGATWSFVGFLRELRDRQFDLVVDLQGLFRSAFMAVVSGAPERIGFANARECAPLLYSRRVSFRDRDMHAVDRNYLFARVLGFDDVPVTFDLPVQPAARAKIEATLAGQGIPPGRPYVLIGPGTRWETKRWPAEHIAIVAKEIQWRHGLPIVLTGTADEIDVARQVEEEAGGRIVNMAGQTNLAEVIALVAGARLAVMHDTGPMHLATALGTPIVAIYGPTSPRRTGPYGHTERIARLDLPCSPCYLKRVADCPYDHRCMRELTPAMVLDKVARVLAEKGETL